jgi:hypothetical protein
MVYMPDGDGAKIPWIFARIIGIYHANVLTPGTSKLQRIKFMHVHYFDQETFHASGPHTRRLDLVQLRSPSATDAFGFIDPSSVIRSAHLIPAFSHGRKDSAALDMLCIKDDWKYYYINR